MGQPSHQDGARQVRLRLPRALHSGEVVLLKVTVGSGEEIVVRDVAGQRLGVISPFGARQNSGASTYVVPVPPEAVAHGRVIVRLSVEHNGQPPRAPTTHEVRSVRLKIGPAPLR